MIFHTNKTQADCGQYFSGSGASPLPVSRRVWHSSPFPPLPTPSTWCQPCAVVSNTCWASWWLRYRLNTFQDTTIKKFTCNRHCPICSLILFNIPLACSLCITLKIFHALSIHCHLLIWTPLDRISLLLLWCFLWGRSYSHHAHFADKYPEAEVSHLLKWPSHEMTKLGLWSR